MRPEQTILGLNLEVDGDDDDEILGTVLHILFIFLTIFSLVTAAASEVTFKLKDFKCLFSG